MNLTRLSKFCTVFAYIQFYDSGIACIFNDSKHVDTDTLILYRLFRDSRATTLLCSIFIAWSRGPLMPCLEWKPLLHGWSYLNSVHSHNCTLTTFFFRVQANFCPRVFYALLSTSLLCIYVHNVSLATSCICIRWCVFFLELANLLLRMLMFTYCIGICACNLVNVSMNNCASARSCKVVFVPWKLKLNRKWKANWLTNNFADERQWAWETQLTGFNDNIAIAST